MQLQNTHELTRVAPRPDELQAFGMDRWFVLHTRSRQEKALADELRKRGTRCFLPLKDQVAFYGRRKVINELPIFSGYLFLLGTVEQAYSADRTGRVARIISVFDQTRLNWELHNLQIALRRRAYLDLYSHLSTGMKVEVRSGPFRGLQGVVENRSDKRNRLILQVGALGVGASLEIDGSILDPV